MIVKIKLCNLYNSVQLYNCLTNLGMKWLTSRKTNQRNKQTNKQAYQIKFILLRQVLEVTLL